MKEFYDLIDKLYEELNSNDFVNTVTFGNIMDVDLAKQSIFPLSHINIHGDFAGRDWIGDAVPSNI